MPSLYCTTLVSLFFGAIIAASAVAVEEPLELPDTIVVTASRLPTTYAELSRSVQVIGRDEIASTPASNLTDLLAYAQGVDVRRRGAYGSQGDISLRGGTFEQTLLLVDGLKVSDPQTGHHHLNLAIDLDDIERIEIVRGSGAKLYGPNAMAGVINIITRAARGNRIEAATTVGEYGLAEQRLAVSRNLGRLDNRLTASRSLSTGWRNNTEFDLKNLGYQAAYRTNRGPLKLRLGYTEKEFGAHQFYSDVFPDEWEATQTFLATGVARLAVGSSLISPKLFWRRHKDEFVLDRARPDWYRNLHTTDHFGSEIQATLPTAIGDLVVGGEIASEQIESKSLGNHQRSRGGLFAEQRLTWGDKWSAVPGVSFFYHEDYGWNAWPGLDLGFRPVESVRLFATTNRSYRVPNYTELFTQSAANNGNPDLEPEEAFSYEVGANLTTGWLRADAALFVRDGTNLIDWARLPGETAWQVQNVFDNTLRGLELGLGVTPAAPDGKLALTQIRIDYSYLDTEQTSGDYESKYLLQHLRHQVNTRLALAYGEQWYLSWAARYGRRLHGDESLVVDAKLSTQVGQARLFLEVNNLFDEQYHEIGTIPRPGRWVRTGLSFELGQR